MSVGDASDYDRTAATFEQTSAPAKSVFYARPQPASLSQKVQPVAVDDGDGPRAKRRRAKQTAFVDEQGDAQGVASCSRRMGRSFAQVAMCLTDARRECAEGCELRSALDLYGASDVEPGGGRGQAVLSAAQTGDKLATDTGRMRTAPTSKPESARRRAYDVLMSMPEVGASSSAALFDATAAVGQIHRPIVPQETVTAGFVYSTEWMGALQKAVKDRCVDMCPRDEYLRSYPHQGRLKDKMKELGVWIRHVSRLVLCGLLQLELGDLNSPLPSDYMIEMVRVRRLTHVQAFLQAYQNVRKGRAPLLVFDPSVAKYKAVPYGPATKCFLTAADGSNTRASLQETMSNARMWAMGEPRDRNKYAERLRSYILEDGAAGARELYIACATYDDTDAAYMPSSLWRKACERAASSLMS